MCKACAWHTAIYYRRCWRLWESQMPTGPSLTRRNSAPDPWVMGGIWLVTHTGGLHWSRDIIITAIKGSGRKAAAKMAKSVMCWRAEMAAWRVRSCMSADSFISSTSVATQSAALLSPREAGLNPKTVIELLLLNLHWGMKTSLRVRQVYWSSLNNLMRYVRNYGMASNWIFMRGPREQPGCHAAFKHKKICCVPGLQRRASPCCAAFISDIACGDMNGPML